MRYYVVSDTFVGRSEHFAGTAEEAAQAEYDAMVNEGEATGEEIDFSPSNFRAWPCAEWPDKLSFAEVFDWIAKQEGWDTK